VPLDRQQVVQLLFECEITPAKFSAAQPYVVWLFDVRVDEILILSGSTYRRSVWNLFAYISRLIPSVDDYAGWEWTRSHD